MRRFAQDCDPPTYSCTSRNAPKKAKLSKGRLRSNGEAARQGPRRKDAKIAHIKSGVRLTRNPTHFASHVAHQNVRQNRFAITVLQLHIRVTHYNNRSAANRAGTDLRKRSHFSRSALRTAPAKAFFIDSIPISFGWTPSTVPSISPAYISSLGRYTRFFQPSAVSFS